MYTQCVREDRNCHAMPQQLVNRIACALAEGMEVIQRHAMTLLNFFGDGEYTCKCQVLLQTRQVVNAAPMLPLLLLLAHMTFNMAWCSIKRELASSLLTGRAYASNTIKMDKCTLLLGRQCDLSDWQRPVKLPDRSKCVEIVASCACACACATQHTTCQHCV